MALNLKSRKARDVAVQVVFLGTVVGALVAAVLVGKRNLDAQGITSGFGFLNRATGFDVGFSLIEFTPYDTFGRLLLVGVLNTIFLGLVGLVLANLMGLAIALFRTSKIPVLSAIGTLYIETFRNIPIILQAFFWYALLTHLPAPKQAFNLLDIAFASTRGVFVPGLNVTAGAAALFFAALFVGLGAALWISLAKRFKRWPAPRRRLWRWLVFGAGLALGIGFLWAGRLADTPLVSLPELRGLNFRGGIRISPELSAMVIAIATYGGAYLAEIIRAGFLAVPKGQIEAAQSLGLAPYHVFSRVRLPLAVRAVFPTLINQNVWLFKATTLGIAVGFTDFFFVISVSINQVGQTIELIAILMVGFLIMNNAISILLNRVNAAIALKGTQLRV